jgi:hypothetical protein
MTHQIELQGTAAGAQFETTRPVFNLSQAGSAILDALAAQTPQVMAAFESVQQRIPLPKNATASMVGRFYRLPNHNRSFCYSLAESGSLIEAPVLVFKGSEPLLQDFQTLLDWMVQAPLRRSSRVMADHFPLAEGKIPGALSLKEATREAQIALDIQKKHLKHYGELARIPVPLIIHSMDESKTNACAASLRRKLSPSAFERIEPLLEGGLAIYIYYYPSPPIRANFWGDMSVPQFRPFIEKALNEDRIVSEWTKLIVRLLYLGYLPYTVRNEGLGACMDFGNATLDGGFCDPDSVVAIEPDTDDEFFRESVIQSVLLLQKTVQLLLGLSGAATLYPSIEEFVCRQLLQQKLHEAIASEARPGLHLDQRLLKLLSPRSSADVKACTNRRNRIPLYTHFAKRLGRI